jgi:hypothetical protein
MLKLRILSITSLLLFLLTVYGLSFDKRFDKQMRKVITHNPDVLAEAIKSVPYEFTQTVNEAIKINRKTLLEQRHQEEMYRFEQALLDPMVPLIREDELVRGDYNAPLLLIMYTDFACPLTVKSFQTVRRLFEIYHNRLQLIVKHLPHEMHANAMISSKYYEALRLQGEELAVFFHDQLFDAHENLRRGEPFLSYMARDLGADMRRLSRDLHSKEVERRIREDMDEAHSFGIRSTPAFLLNGIPITGAYPEEHFRALIEKLQNKSLVSF